MSQEILREGPHTELEYALKCVRGLFYQNKVWLSTSGKQGKQVLFKRLSPEDQSALRFVQKNKGGDIPSELHAFVDRILLNDSK